MKKLNLGGTTLQSSPLDMSQLTKGMTIVNLATGEHAMVVAVFPNKVTYRDSTGQYSMLPADFVKRFAAIREPSYEECKRNLSKALDVPDDVAATILKTGKMPEGF